MVMVRTTLCFAVLIILTVSVSNAQRYNYGLNPTLLPDYKRSIDKNPANELIDLASFVPGVVLDIRYATPNNFTKEVIYKQAKAYARKPVAAALKEAQKSFAQHGVGIKIFDAYRPYSATVKFYEVYKDTTYVASPYRGSRHNRGCAIDMTLVDLKTGKELKMPTEFDSFKKEAWPSTIIKDAEAKKNRDLIISVMTKHGFKVNSSEWWHFDFIGWQKFDVLDIDFEKLEK
jgi:D-alanyl-D-alanine dipeptidase